MAINIVGPSVCEVDGLCHQCLSAICRHDEMYHVTSDDRPRDWESVCSRECGEAREVSLALAGDLEAQAAAIRRGRPT